MSDIDIQPIIAAAEAGGAVLNKYFGKSLKTTQKSIAVDLVTEADVESEQAVIKILEKAFPNFNIAGEESGLTNHGSDYTFSIDPLDGTNNFVAGLPLFSVSIGLLKNDQVIAGAIHHPIIGDTYYAEAGKGAYLDGVKLAVNRESAFGRATIAYTEGYSEDWSAIIHFIHGVTDKGVKKFLNTWSATLDFCLLASGRIEGMVNNGTELHDYAAGLLIAREAGAVITDFSGQPIKNDRMNKFVVSNNTFIHQELLEIVKDYQ